jgi:hypothetical protein
MSKHKHRRRKPLDWFTALLNSRDKQIDAALDDLTEDDDD